MDLLNMTDRTKIQKFYKKVKIEEILSLKPFISVWKLATNAKFQLNISKIMPPRPNKTLVHV